MPCLAHEYRQPRLPATNHCKSLSCLVRETYAHYHVPCVGRMRGAGWSSGDDSDDALDTKQVVLNEMRNRQLKRKESRCSVESSTLSSTFVWSFAPLEPSPRSVLEKVSSPEKRVFTVEEEEKEEAASDDGHGDADDEVQSEAFFSVKSFFTRSTSRAATMASSTAEARGSEDGCGGRRRRISRSISSSSGRQEGSAGEVPRRRVTPAPSLLAWIWGWRRGLRRRAMPAPSSVACICWWRRGLRRRSIPAPSSAAWIWGRSRGMS